MTTTKLSSAQRQEVLAEVPGILRSLVTERDFYKTAYEANASRTKVVKLASAMIEKGVRSGDITTLADELEKEAADGHLDLDITTQAVAMVGRDMGKHAHVSDEHSGSSGGSDLENFVLS